MIHISALYTSKENSIIPRIILIMAANAEVLSFRQGPHYVSLLHVTATVVSMVVFFLTLRFFHRYRKALKQFFWAGNLDQTMADDIHEKWRRWHVQYGSVFQTVSQSALSAVGSR
jgi:hypothetical protein